MEVMVAERKGGLLYEGSRRKAWKKAGRKEGVKGERKEGRKEGREA